MDNKKPPIIIGVFRNACFALLFFAALASTAQNSKIKCYFNHSVNPNVSTGTPAINVGTGLVDTLIAYINRANVSIDLCVYNYYIQAGDGMDAIATAINNAYGRGVVIRWIGNGSSSNNGWVNLNANIKTLSSPTTSGYGISHNKFVIFDQASATDAILWTGSYNFSRQQTSADFNNVVIIQDKPLATAYYNEFNKMWGGTGASPNLANSKFGTNKTASTTNSFTVNGTPIEVYFSPKDGAAAKLTASVNSANNELFFGIYTFTDNNVANAIKTRINAGVTANGIMDVFSQTYSPYTTLSPGTVMGANLKVYNGGGSSLYHNKIMLVDALHAASDPQVCTGSYNWTASANTSNDENFIVVHDATLANQYYQSLCKNFADVGGTACPLMGIADFDYTEKQVAVYPNPAQDVVHVKVKNSTGILKVTLTNSLGQVLNEKEVRGTDELSLDIGSLTPGIYFVNVFRGDKSFCEKLIK